ncbi:MAG: lytic transglycosylase domain-containing protein [Verrucomicrobia bacterium]|nr:lytic transglycosylase domain-containing protein [Verrucomicrobiota bacterium]
MQGIFRVVTIAALMIAAPARVRAISTIDFDVLATAIADIESGGRADAVGLAGERGLMQIKSDTWRETSLRVFNRPVPYSRAFEPRMNLLIGQAYLEHLGDTLLSEQDHFQDDYLPLLVASYNNGPERIVSLNYSLTELSEERKDYVQRVLNLHQVYSQERTRVPADAERRVSPPPLASVRKVAPGRISRNTALPTTKPHSATVAAGATGLPPLALLGMGWATYRRRRYVLAVEHDFLRSLIRPTPRRPAAKRR